MITLSGMVAALAVLSAVVLVGTAASVFALYRAYRILRAIDASRVEPAAAATVNGEIAELRTALEAMAAELHLIQHAPGSDAQIPGAPKSGFNLSKRTQALRMHRRGEDAAKIASALELPRQEVDLLFKVHRIVLSNV
jgi:hypothetical protein